MIRGIYDLLDAGMGRRTWTGVQSSGGAATLGYLYFANFWLLDAVISQGGSLSQSVLTFWAIVGLFGR
jgi:hypothetical protein